MKPGSELDRTTELVLYWGLNLERRRSFDSFHKSEERFEGFGAERSGAKRPMRAGSADMPMGDEHQGDGQAWRGRSLTMRQSCPVRCWESSAWALDHNGWKSHEVSIRMSGAA